jgi:hypothetical protein
MPENRGVGNTATAEHTTFQQSGTQVSEIGTRLLKVLETTECLARHMRARLGDDAGDEIDDALELIVRSVDARIAAAALANTKASTAAH